MAIVAVKLKAWGASINAIGSSLFLVSGAILAPLGLLVKTFADMGSALNAASQRTGIAVEELSALQFAAEQSSASFEELEAGIRKMQAQGKGKGTADLLKFADEIAAMNDPAKQAAKAMDIFGKAGVKLLPMLKGGADGLKVLMDKAEAAGVVMSTTDAQAATALGDSMSEMGDRVKFAAFQVGAALAPAVMDLLQAARPVIATVSKWIKENRGLIVSLAKMAVLLGTVGVALIVLGKGLILLGAAVTVLKVAVGILAGTLSFLLSPIGLVALAVGGLVAAFLLLTERGSKIRGEFAGLWEDLKTTALSTWQGIVDAIMAGDLELAWQIALAGMKVAWLQTLVTLEAAWLDFARTGASDTSSWEATVLSWVDSFVLGIHVLRRAWAEFVQDITGAYAMLLRIARLAEAAGVGPGAVGLSLMEDNAAAAFRQRQEEFRQADAELRQLANRPGIAQRAAEGGPDADLARSLREAQETLDRLRNEAAQRRAANLPVPGRPGGEQAGLGESAGAFGGFGLRGLQGGDSVQEQQRDLLEEQLQVLRDLLGDVRVREGGIFG